MHMYEKTIHQYAKMFNADPQILEIIVQKSADIPVHYENGEMIVNEGYSDSIKKLWDKTESKIKNGEYIDEIDGSTLNSTLSDSLANSLDSTSLSVASGKNLPYVVIQVTLKEKFLGTGSSNLSDLEYIINRQVKKGYRLHTMSTSNGGSKGLGGGDRIQATLVFERLDFSPR